MWDIFYKFGGKMQIFRAFTEQEFVSFVKLLCLVGKKPVKVQFVLS